jgi:uncharacterized repeat protein (TIGR01451 family)
MSMSLAFSCAVGRWVVRGMPAALGIGVALVLAPGGGAWAQVLRNAATGDVLGLSLDESGAVVQLDRVGTVLATAVGEVRPAVLLAGTTGNSMTYELLPTLGTGDTGFRRIELVAPPGFSNLVVSTVSVLGADLSPTNLAPGPGQFRATSSGDTTFVDLGAKVTTTAARILVRFSADAPPAAGAFDFTSRVADLNLVAPVTAGDADGVPANGASMTVQVVESQGIVVELESVPDKEHVIVGEVVTFLVTVRNLLDADVDSVHVEAQLPPTFAFLENTARVDSIAVVPDSDGRTLRFDLGTLPARSDANGNGRADAGEAGYRAITYQVVAGAGATAGRWIGHTVAKDFCDACIISNDAAASVEVVQDPDFDLGTILGKVFRDDDANGSQDPGEHGLGRVKVVLDDGTYALTDEFGRFHFPVVEPGYHLLKIDNATVPASLDSQSPDDALVRVTPGLMVEANFGVRVREESVVIGRDAVLGDAMVREVGVNSIEILGNVRMPSLMVNGKEVAIPSVSVRLGRSGRENAIELRGGTVAEPVRFLPTVTAEEPITRWALALTDTTGMEVRTIEGTGPPPSEIVWAGDLQREGSLEPGQILVYQLSVRLADGAVARSPKHLAAANATSAVSFRLSGDSFGSDDAELSGAAREALKEAARVIRRYPGQRIAVEGHTDDVGRREHNLSLSQQRAMAAVAYLTDILGLPRSQFVARGLADERPIASNLLPEGRALNRRVEIRADLEETVGGALADQFRTTPHVTVNGETIQVGELGRFSVPIQGASVREVAIALSDSLGQSYEAKIAVPHFEIHEPDGVQVLPPSAAGDGDGTLGLMIGLAGRTDPRNTVEVDDVVTPLGPDGTLDMQFRLKGPRNTFRILIRNPEGYTRIVNLSVDLTDRDDAGQRWVASERVPLLEVRWPPEGDRLPGPRLEVSGSTESGNRIVVNGEPWAVDAGGAFRGTVVLPPSGGRVAVEVEDGKGGRGVVEREFQVAPAGLFLLALADGEFGRLEANGFLEGAGESDGSRWYAEGRLVYYLEGWVAGKYLVRSAFDTGHDDVEKLFDDLRPDESERLLESLDPDRMYPVYGDGSTVVYGTESQGKFYLAVESEELAVLVGNYPVDLTGPELAAYQRTLYGARAAYRSASRTPDGEPDTQLVVFGADVRLVHVRNELGATGGALYYLSHRDVVEGSEQVSLLVRDKNTGLLLRRVAQQRNVDYTVKYGEGRLIFRRPIRSVEPDGTIVDEALLAGHPVTVQVDYETRLAFLQESAAGAHARQQLGDHVAVGGTVVDDDQVDGSYRLRGVDGEMRVRGGRFVAEYAQSEGRDGQALFSSDGGLSWEEDPASPAWDGSAWKVAAELDPGDWVEPARTLHLDGYYKTLDAGFAANGQAPDRGRQSYGGTLGWSPLASGQLALRWNAEELTIGAPFGAATRSRVLSGQWDQTYDRWGLSFEYLDRRNEDSSGDPLLESSYGAARLSRRLAQHWLARADYQATLSGPDNDRATAGLQYEAAQRLSLDLEGSHGSRGSSAQGGAILNWGGGRLYVREALTDGPSGDRVSTAVGAESPLGRSSKVYTEYQWDHTAGSDRTLSLLGVQRNWEAGPGLRFALGAEHADVDADVGETDRSTVSGSVSYQPREGLTAGSSQEVRHETGALDRLQLVTSNRLDVAVAPDVTLLGRYRWSRTEDRERDLLEARYQEGSVGLAWRPVATDRYQGLAKYTRLEDLRPTLAGRPSAERGMSVLSVEGTVDLTRRLQWYAKGAARVLEESYETLPTVTTHTYLGIHRLDFTVHRPFDVGVEYRVLAQREADDRRDGFVTELSRRLAERFRVGVGFNFTGLSDDEFADNDFSRRGWYLRAHGMY